MKLDNFYLMKSNKMADSMKKTDFSNSFYHFLNFFFFGSMKIFSFFSFKLKNLHFSVNFTDNALIKKIIVRNSSIQCCQYLKIRRSRHLVFLLLVRSRTSHIIHGNFELCPPLKNLFFAGSIFFV